MMWTQNPLNDYDDDDAYEEALDEIADEMAEDAHYGEVMEYPEDW